MSENEKTYQDKVWRKDDSGEWEYVGPETLELTFDPPLKIGDKDTSPVSSIMLREPTAAHLSTFLKAQRSNDDAEAGALFISTNAGIAPTYIRKMRSRDFYKAMEFLGGFTPPEKKQEG